MGTHFGGVITHFLGVGTHLGESGNSLGGGGNFNWASIGLLELLWITCYKIKVKNKGKGTDG